MAVPDVVECIINCCRGAKDETEGSQEVIMRTGASILFGAFALSAIQRMVLGEGSVTFAKDVAPILQRSCQNCHRDGSICR